MIIPILLTVVFLVLAFFITSIVTPSVHMQEESSPSVFLWGYSIVLISVTGLSGVVFLFIV